MTGNAEKRMTLSDVARRWGKPETTTKRILDRHGCPKNAYGMREPTESFVRAIERTRA